MEKSIEARLRTKVKKELHGMALKFVSPGTTGVPDRLVALPNGLMYFVELKDTRGKLSPRQIIVHKQLRLMGIIVAVLSSNEEVDAWIAERKKEMLEDF